VGGIVAAHRSTPQSGACACPKALKVIKVIEVIKVTAVGSANRVLSEQKSGSGLGDAVAMRHG